MLGRLCSTLQVDKVQPCRWTKLLTSHVRYSRNSEVVFKGDKSVARFLARKANLYGSNALEATEVGTTRGRTF